MMRWMPSCITPARKNDGQSKFGMGMGKAARGQKAVARYFSADCGWVSMKRFVNPFIDVRRGEFSLVFLMFSYYYLVLVTNYFLKPTRDSLFLVRLGADQLPLTFILIAVVVLPITTSYARFSRSLPLTRLINITTAVFVGNLLILRGLIGLDQTWVYYLFYVWGPRLNSGYSPIRYSVHPRPNGCFQSLM